jgi:predicted transcriptional regulator
MMVLLAMPRPLVESLDKEAKKIDRPRAWLMRQILARALAANEKTA